jgi:hypothetical protein
VAHASAFEHLFCVKSEGGESYASALYNSTSNSPVVFR